MPLPKVILNSPHFSHLDPDKQSVELQALVDQLPEGSAFLRAPSQQEKNNQGNENFVIMVRRKQGAVAKFKLDFVAKGNNIHFVGKDKKSYDSLDAVLDVFIQRYQFVFINCPRPQVSTKREENVHFSPSAKSSSPVMQDVPGKLLGLDRETLESAYFFPMANNPRQRVNVLAALKVCLPKGFAFFCYADSAEDGGGKKVKFRKDGIKIVYREANGLKEQDIRVETKRNNQIKQTAFFLPLTIPNIDDLMELAAKKFKVGFIVNCISFTKFKNLGESTLSSVAISKAQQTINQHLVCDDEAQRKIFNTSFILREGCRYTLTQLVGGFYLATYEKLVENVNAYNFVLSYEQIEKVLAWSVRHNHKSKDNEVEPAQAEKQRKMSLHYTPTSSQESQSLQVSEDNQLSTVDEQSRKKRKNMDSEAVPAPTEKRSKTTLITLHYTPSSGDDSPSQVSQRLLTQPPSLTN